MKESNNSASQGISGTKQQTASAAKTRGTICYSIVSDRTRALRFRCGRLTAPVPGPVIRFLSDSIRPLGSSIASSNIHCRRCTQRKGGGFDPEYGILLCANELKSRDNLEDTLAHEMVHAYDHLRFKVDWASNLRHAACTEVGISTHEEAFDADVLSSVFCLDPSKFAEWRV